MNFHFRLFRYSMFYFNLFMQLFVFHLKPLQNIHFILILFGRKENKVIRYQSITGKQCYDGICYPSLRKKTGCIGKDVK